MLLFLGKKMRETLRRDVSECVVWSNLSSESHLVGLEYEYRMLLRLGRLNTCLSLYLLPIGHVVVVRKCHHKNLEEDSARDVGHPLPLLQPSGFLNLMMNQLYCREEEGCILRTQTLNVLQKSGRKVRRPVLVVAAVVLRLSCSPVPVNFYISSHVSAIAF